MTRNELQEIRWRLLDEVRKEECFKARNFYSSFCIVQQDTSRRSETLKSLKNLVSEKSKDISESGHALRSGILWPQNTSQSRKSERN